MVAISARCRPSYTALPQSLPYLWIQQDCDGGDRHCELHHLFSLRYLPESISSNYQFNIQASPTFELLPDFSVGGSMLPLWLFGFAFLSLLVPPTLCKITEGLIVTEPTLLIRLTLLFWKHFLLISRLPCTTVLRSTVLSRRHNPGSGPWR